MHHKINSNDNNSNSSVKTEEQQQQLKQEQQQQQKQDDDAPINDENAHEGFAGSDTPGPDKVSVTLCLYSSTDISNAKFYPRSVLIGRLESDLRKFFNIEEAIESKMWVNATKNHTPDQTLAELIKDKDFDGKPCPDPSNQSVIITLETKNQDGVWPSSKPADPSHFPKRAPKFRPGLCGLSNMGNTCFMNSALQCLSNTPPLTQYILSGKFVDDINTNNPLGMRGEIARTYAGLIKLMWAGTNNSFLPREFKCVVSRFAPQFNGFAQQDCQELMAFLLDGLHEDLNRIREKPYIEVKNETERRPDEELAEESWSNYKKRNDSVVVDTFHAMLKSTLVCPGCQLVSVTFDPFCYLSLPLPVKREQQINLKFIPAPRKVDLERISGDLLKQLEQEEIKVIEEYGGSISSFSGTIERRGCYYTYNRPKGCKLQVPRSGPVGEICEIVARILNDEPSGNKVVPDKLVVAELSSDGRFSKVYESNEHYNQFSDDIVVVEKANNYLIPMYIKECKNGQNPKLASTNGTVIGKPVFLHVPNLKYETLYKSTIASLSNLSGKDGGLEEEEIDMTFDEWYSLSKIVEDSSQSEPTPTEEPVEENQMDYEEDNTNSGQPANSVLTEGDQNGISKTNGISKLPDKPFELFTVNSSGYHSIEKLGKNKRECDYNSKLYIGVTFDSRTVSLPQFKHIRRVNFLDAVDPIIPRANTRPTLQLQDCITQFANVERLGADDPWYCPRCKKHQQATKKFDIWSLPKVLIIHLKRFSYSRSWRDKIDTLVEFPVDNLDMSKHVLNPSQKEKSKLIYNLIGVANHFGGLGGGHYTAFAKNASLDAWYNFDDALVNHMQPSNVVTRSAYVLFYQLQEH